MIYTSLKYLEKLTEHIEVSIGSDGFVQFGRTNLTLILSNIRQGNVDNSQIVNTAICVTNH